MATATTAPRVSYDEWGTRRWRLTGLVLAVVWLVTVSVVGLTGAKRSDLATLEAGVADGSVTEVEIVGLPDRENWRGPTTVELKWRGDVLARFAEVSVDTRRNPRGSWEGERILVSPDERLRSLQPDLVITASESSSGAYLEWRGWRGSGWAALLGLAT